MLCLSPYKKRKLPEMPDPSSVSKGWFWQTSKVSTGAQNISLIYEGKLSSGITIQGFTMGDRKISGLEGSPLEDKRTERIQEVSPARMSNPLDINGPDFDCEAYLSQMLKKKSLQELLDIEHGMVQEVRRLDCDMQTLVYENYNKFITATDTIRKMKSDFVKMEDEMDKLAQNMAKITDSSERVSSALSGKRENVQKLAKASSTLRNLEFLFELPENLQGYVNKKEYSLAVRSYVRARSILHQYRDVPAFSKIYEECEGIVEDLKEQLKEQFRSSVGSTKESAMAVNELLRLGESPASLAHDFLISAESHLAEQLESLNDQVRLKQGDSVVREEMVRRPADNIPNLPVDVLEFADGGCSRYLGDLSLVITSYSDMFLSEPESAGLSNKSSVETTGDAELKEFVKKSMDNLFEVAEARFLLEKNPSESSLVVRALDRFYRRLQASSKLLPGVNYADASLGILVGVGQKQVELSFQYLDAHFQSLLKDARQQLAATHKTFLSAPGSGSEGTQVLSELLTKMEHSTIHNLKTALANLLQFTAYDVTFANKSRFLLSFGHSVRKDLVVQFFERIVEIGKEFCEGRGDKAYVNATLILVLSRFAKNLEASTAGYILDLCEQQFRLSTLMEEAKRKGNLGNITLTPARSVTSSLGVIAQELLDHFVEMEGFSLSQLLVKSVETRDWLGCVEPRAVRAVMKRVVEDLTAIDTKVGQLFEEGSRKENSDSSKRTGGMHSIASRPNRPNVPLLGDSALNNTLGKLWTERIDYFASVDFNKVSVLTGIVKICLKTLLESVRLRWFGRYGLQQVQVFSRPLRKIRKIVYFYANQTHVNYNLL